MRQTKASNGMATSSSATKMATQANTAQTCTLSAQGVYRGESPDENEFDHDEVFDDDDHSDHGDDVGQEEDDPG